MGLSPIYSPRWDYSP